MSSCEKAVRVAVAALEAALTELGPTSDVALCKAEGLLLAALLATKEAQPYIEDLT